MADPQQVPSLLPPPAAAMQQLDDFDRAREEYRKRRLAQTAPPKTGPDFIDNVANASLRVGGGIGGGALGLLGGPFAPITVPLGAAIGGSLGEYGAQANEKHLGMRDDFNEVAIGLQGALNAVPWGKVAMPFIGKATTPFGPMARQGAVAGGVGGGLTAISEGQNPIMPTLTGAGLGAGLGSLASLIKRPKVSATPPPAPATSAPAGPVPPQPGQTPFNVVAPSRSAGMPSGPVPANLSDSAALLGVDSNANWTLPRPKVPQAPPPAPVANPETDIQALGNLIRSGHVIQPPQAPPVVAPPAGPKPVSRFTPKSQPPTRLTVPVPLEPEAAAAWKDLQGRITPTNPKGNLSPSDLADFIRLFRMK